MKKQSVNVRLTTEANKILAYWRKLFGGRNKSETIANVNALVINKPHNESTNKI